VSSGGVWGRVCTLAATGLGAVLVTSGKTVRVRVVASGRPACVATSLWEGHILFAVFCLWLCPAAAGALPALPAWLVAGKGALVLDVARVPARATAKRSLLRLLGVSNHDTCVFGRLWLASPRCSSLQAQTSLP